MCLIHNEAKQTETWEFGTKKGLLQGHTRSGSCLKDLNAPKGFNCVLTVVNIFHLLKREDFLHLQNNSGNVHQILLLSYLRGAKAEDAGESLSGKVP